MFWSRSSSTNSTSQQANGSAGGSPSRANGSAMAPTPPPSSSLSSLHTTLPSSGKKTDWMTMPPPRSPRLQASSGHFVLSDQRRQELLLAARTNRVSWIDGATAGSTPSAAVSATGPSGSASATTSRSVAPLHHQAACATTAASSAELLPSYTSIPVKFQQLLEDTTQQLVEFLLQLEQMKQLVAWVEVTSAATAPLSGKVHAASAAQQIHKPKSSLLTICQEIEHHKQAIGSWRRAFEQDPELDATAALSGFSSKCLSEEEKQLVFLACFDELTAFLKQTFAWEFVYQIQHFVKLFEQKHQAQMGPRPGQSDEPVSATVSAALGAFVHEFVMKMVGQFQRNAVFRDFVSPKSLLLQEDMLYEVLESFVMEKIYHVAFVRLQRQDEALHNRMEQLKFIDFHHLDLHANCFAPPKAKAKWKQLQLQLEQMVRMPSPKRKMDVFLQVCDAISRFLSEFTVVPCQPEDEEPEMTEVLNSLHGAEGSEDGDKPDEAATQNRAARKRVHRRSSSGAFLPSADDFLPALIFLVLKTNPSWLKSQVEYIMQYRHPSKLLSKAGYFFTHLMSSIAFLEQLNATNLSISTEEFEKGVQQMKKRQKEAASLARASAQAQMRASQTGVASSTSVHSGSLLRNKMTEVQPDDGMPTILEIRARRRAMMR